MKLKILDTLKINNFDDPKRPTKLANLWGKNFNKVKETLSSGKNIGYVYHSYESNFKQGFQVSLCVEDDIDGEFETEACFWKSYKVDFYDSLGIAKAWEKIWEDEEKEIVRRAYTFDYEVYTPDGRVMIKISVQ